jgi:hypothetical protein
VTGNAAARVGELVGGAVGDRVNGDAEGARVGDSEGPVGAAVGTAVGSPCTDPVLNVTIATKPVAVLLVSEWKRIVTPVELTTTTSAHAAPLHMDEYVGAPVAST